MECGTLMTWNGNEMAPPVGRVTETPEHLRFPESRLQEWEPAVYEKDTALSAQFFSNGTVDFNTDKIIPRVLVNIQVWRKTKTTISEANWYFSVGLTIDHILRDLKYL